MIKIFAAISIIFSCILMSFKMHALLFPIVTTQVLIIDDIVYGELLESTGLSQKSTDDIFRVKFKKRVNKQTSLYRWADQYNQNTSMAKKNLVIKELDQRGRIVQEFNLQNCYPIKWTMIHDNNQSPLTEHLELAVQNITRQ